MKDTFFLHMKLLWGRDFSGGPLVKAPCFQCRAMCLIPGQGINILHDVRQDQKKKKVKNPIKKILLVGEASLGRM